MENQSEFTFEVLKRAAERLNENGKKAQKEYKKRLLINVLEYISASKSIVNDVKTRGIPETIYTHDSIKQNIKELFQMFCAVKTSAILPVNKIYLSWQPDYSSKGFASYYVNLVTSYGENFTHPKFPLPQIYGPFQNRTKESISYTEFYTNTIERVCQSLGVTKIELNKSIPES